LLQQLAPAYGHHKLNRHHPAHEEYPVIRSILVGAIAGMRSMLPLATLSYVGRAGKLTSERDRARSRGHNLVTAGLLVLAVGELVGDKWSGAPDRISPAGLAARVTNGALAAAAVAPRNRRYSGALLGSVAAVAAGYLSFRLRAAAMRRFGQVTTGVAEDAIALGATLWTLSRARAGS
jgi:uncharacterized membrane protein